MSPAHTRFLWTSLRTGSGQVFAVDADNGDTINVSRGVTSYDRYPSWSPSGERVAFTSNRDGAFNLYVCAADGSNVVQLTHERSPVVCGMQSWAADESRIYFAVFEKGDPCMCRISPEGGRFEELGWGIDPAISPDGETLVFTRNYNEGHLLFAAAADLSGLRQLTTAHNPFAGMHPVWTPSGRHVVYADAVGSALELFIWDLARGDRKQLTSFGKAATSPAVSPDGEWITFRLCDHVFWRDPEISRKTYLEKRADLRPVWMMRIDGSEAAPIEILRYHTTVDGSRVPVRFA